MKIIHWYKKRMLLANILMTVIMLLEVRWLDLQFYGFTCRGLVDEWALGLAYFAYRCARYDAQDHRFSFGSWKIEISAADRSAVFLLVVALFMAFQSVNDCLNRLLFRIPRPCQW
nr:cation transporter [Acinetobacter sp. 10FS3-1]